MDGQRHGQVQAPGQHLCHELAVKKHWDSLRDWFRPVEMWVVKRVVSETFHPARWI